MLKTILKRIVQCIPTLFIVVTFTFILTRAIPGNPAQTLLGPQATAEDIAAMEVKLGLDQPKWKQYIDYMGDVLHGDFGTSYMYNQPVVDLILQRIPSTLQITLTSLIIALIVGVGIGMFSALHQYSAFDYVFMVLALVGVSMPIFWLGLLLILLFSLRLGWFPVSGKSGFSSIVLPAIALGFNHMASIARTTRSSMLETIRQDYIRTVRAKGVAYGVVIRKHALKNALIPVITVIGLQIGYMLGGSVLTETVFAWPGVGRLMVDSINGRDIPMVMGCIILVCATFSLVNLAVDILYGFVDPRIKSQYKSGGKSK